MMLIEPVFDREGIPGVQWLVLIPQLTETKVELGREHVLNLDVYHVSTKDCFRLLGKSDF